MSQVHKGSNLYINGLPVAHAGPGGHCTAQEECWVTVAGQKVKQPFTNMAYSKDLTATTSRVFVNGYPIATLASNISQSYGDLESEGGVKSGTTGGKARFLTCSHNVFYEGNGVVRHGDQVISNMDNTEVSDWVQPTQGSSESANILSDLIEELPAPVALNVELIRNPNFSFVPAHIQQSICVTHQETGKRFYTTFGIFKQNADKYLWHGDIFREGTYTVEEIYTTSSRPMRIPLGTIKTVSKDDTTPGLVLVPLTFKRYDDIQKSYEGSKSLYSDTYLYLFKDGYLWRAIYVNRHGNWYEIDFSGSHKKISPNSNAQLSQGILLPIQDSQGSHDFDVVTSHIALSWDTIHQLGGLDPQDLRFTENERRSVPPDPGLIKQRFEHIDIRSLIENNEIITTIATCKTENELLRNVHVCAPPLSNRNWVVERERFNHSTGVEQAENNLYWHKPTPPKTLHTPTLTNLQAHPPEKQPVLGSAIFIVDDPLGRLHQTADQMLDQHFEYVAFVEDNGQPYALGELVGQMLEMAEKNDKDYVKHVRDEERKKFMQDYDEVSEAYLATMREEVERLKHWYEASFARGQWEDYYRVPMNSEAVANLSPEYFKLAHHVYSAFLLHPEGVEYLEKEANKSSGRIEEMTSFVKALSKVEQVPILVYLTTTLMSSLLEPTSKSFHKIVDFFETTLKFELAAKLVPVSIEELASFHQGTLLKEAGPASSYFRVQTGKISKVNSFQIQAPSGKQISMVMVEHVPSYQWIRKVPNFFAPIEKNQVENFEKFSSAISKSDKLKIGLSALAIFSSKHILYQLKEKHELGELTAGTATLLSGEILRNALFAAHFAFDSKIVSQGIWKGEVSHKASAYAKGFNITAVIVGIIVDAAYSVKYGLSGEYDLALAYGLSTAGGLATMFWLLTPEKMVALSRMFGIAGLVLGITALILISIFTKNDDEKWLHEGYWGTVKKEKKEILKSIEEFHFLVTMVTLISVGPSNIKASRDLTLTTSAMYPWLPMRALEPIKALSLMVRLPPLDNILLEVKIMIQTDDGDKLFRDDQLTHTVISTDETGLTWEIQIEKKHFRNTPHRGWVTFTCFEQYTHALLGEDNYKFEFNQDINSYNLDKVHHGHNS